MVAPVDSFDVTIQTSGVDDTFTLPTKTGYSYSANVDWGDSSSSTITAFDDADITHTYSVEGLYTIKITGTFEAWSFNNGGDKLMATAVHFGSEVTFKYFRLMFFGCSNLVTVTGQILADVATTSGDNVFNACSSLVNIPSDLITELVNIEVFSGFFTDCTSLGSIPSGFFNFVGSATVYQLLFGGCTSLAGSSEELWLNEDIAGTYSLTAPDYSNGAPPAPNGGDCYQNCTGLSDYASIPTYWK